MNQPQVRSWKKWKRRRGRRVWSSIGLSACRLAMLNVSSWAVIIVVEVHSLRSVLTTHWQLCWWSLAHFSISSSEYCSRHLHKLPTHIISISVIACKRLTYWSRLLLSSKIQVCLRLSSFACSKPSVSKKASKMVTRKTQGRQLQTVSIHLRTCRKTSHGATSAW